MVSSRRGEGLIFPKARRPRRHSAMPAGALSPQEHAARWRAARRTRTHAALLRRRAVARTLTRAACAGRVGDGRNCSRGRGARKPGGGGRARCSAGALPAPRHHNSRRQRCQTPLGVPALPLPQGLAASADSAPHPCRLGDRSWAAFASQARRTAAWRTCSSCASQRCARLGGMPCPVALFAHASLQELAVWPERHERQREWVRVPAARSGRDGG